MATTPATESERIHTYSSNATFVKKGIQPCRFRTANSPGESDHPAMVYTFRIDSLTVVTNPDSKQAKWCPPVEEGAEHMINETSFDTVSGDAGEDSLQDVAKSLTEGDSVELHWTHDYVKRGMAYSPEYPVTKLVKL